MELVTGRAQTAPRPVPEEFGHDSAHGPATDRLSSTGVQPGRPGDEVLLGYAVIAGPVHVTVVLAPALTRGGFDLRRHPCSLLADGSRGR